MLTIWIVALNLVALDGGRLHAVNRAARRLLGAGDLVADTRPGQNGDRTLGQSLPHQTRFGLSNEHVWRGHRAKTLDAV